jgi:MFS family permease
LVEISIAQVFFSHERGYYIGIYAFLLFGSNFLAPALSGFVFDGIGCAAQLACGSFGFDARHRWAWTMYWSALIAGGCAIFLFLFMEETNCK